MNRKFSSPPEPSRALDWVSFCTLLLLTFGLLLLESNFLQKPGVEVDLPCLDASLVTFAAIDDRDTLIVRDEDCYLFRSEILHKKNLAIALKKWDNQGQHLLLLLPRQLPMETFLFVSKSAQEAGFQSVHLAISSPKL